MHKKERLVVLDITKIICALLIYMRHSMTMFDCSYGNSTLDFLIYNVTEPVMVCFFIISGFSIYYSNCHKDLLNRDNLKEFYKKRFITIFPTYFLVHILTYLVTDNTVQQAVYATPIELMGLQSMFGGFFGILHGGATWFISSLLLGYFIYPIVQELMKMQKNYRYITAFVIFFTLIYSVVVVSRVFSLGIDYVDPVFRTLQFVFGTSLCAVFINLENDKAKKRQSDTVILMLLNLGLTIAFVIFAFHYNVGCEKTLVPVYYFAIAATMSISLKFNPDFLTKNIVIKYASGLTYYFFILQVFVWGISYEICKLTGLETNVSKLVISFITCVTLSILCKELFDKPVKRILQNQLSRVEKQASKREKLITKN